MLVDITKNTDDELALEDVDVLWAIRILLVTDFICGMTDSYAAHIYQQLLGINIYKLFYSIKNI